MNRKVSGSTAFDKSSPRPLFLQRFVSYSKLFLLFVIREAASIFIFPRSHHPLLFENKIFLFARFHWIPCIGPAASQCKRFWCCCLSACLVGWGQSFTHISLLVSSLHTTHITRCCTYVLTELADDSFFLVFFECRTMSVFFFRTFLRSNTHRNAVQN